jgi:uncharacterized protein with HEPN domain
MSRSQREHLRHILDEAEYLISKSQALSRDQFVRDETLKRAFVRSLEIIGEATKQVPAAMRQKYPQIDWRAMAGMRDKLIHGYFGVDYDLVWDVVSSKIPELRREIAAILQDEGWL